MVKLSGYLKCKNSEEVESIKNHLPEHIRLSRAETGCHSFAVIETENPLIWKVEEAFVDKSSFEAHQQRTKASVWGKATASIAREYTVSK